MEKQFKLSSIKENPEAFIVEGNATAEYNSETEIYTVKHGSYEVDVNNAEIELLGNSIINLTFAPNTKTAHVDVTKFNGQFKWDTKLVASFSEGSISLSVVVPEKTKVNASSGVNRGKSTPTHYDHKRFL